MDNRPSLSIILRSMGCLIFDIAIIIAFFNVFSLFSFLMPVKSILMLLFLLLGLAVLNGAIVFPRLISDTIGIPYSASIIILSILYAVSSNILSAFLIVGGVVTYLVWEFILLAIFVLLLSFLALFSKKTSANKQRDRAEQSEKTSVNLQLMQIDSAINLLQNDSDIRSSFLSLEERINASTPFGRITDNSAVEEVEDMIKENLQNIRSGITSGMDEKQADETKKLIENTRRLVINREKLIVK